MAAETDRTERLARIAAARRQIGQLGAFAPGRLALGCAPIDAHLEGGLVPGALHEVAAADHRALPAAQGFLLALARMAAGDGVIAWVLDRRGGEFGAPYAPGLKAFGLDPARILFIRSKTREEALWAMEEALRIGGIGAVVGLRPARMDLTASRRLQLAAEAAALPIFLLRPHKDDAASAAVTRWRVAPHKAARDGFGFLALPRWQVTLERVRGGRPGQWVVEWNHDTLCLRLPAAFRGGALAAQRPGTAA